MSDTTQVRTSKIRQEIGLYALARKAAQEAQQQLGQKVDAIHRSGLCSDAVRFRAMEGLARACGALQAAVENLDEAIRQAGDLDQQIAEAARIEAGEPERKTVRIPGCVDHAGLHIVAVELVWLCPECGGPRGEPFDTLSYDGSRRLEVQGWVNPCGHTDQYGAVRTEAGLTSCREHAHG